MSGLLAVGYFLFALLFSLLVFVLWARIALRYFKVSPLHPMSQAIHRLTDPLVMAHHTPLKKGPRSRYDWPCFCVLVLVELLKFIALGALFLGAMLPWSFVPLYTVADLIVEPCNLLFYAVLVRVIMSWINPTWHHPLADLLRIVTEPALRLGRQLLPERAGFDFSPIVVMVVLKIITLFISASLPLQLI